MKKSGMRVLKLLAMVLLSCLVIFSTQAEPHECTTLRHVEAKAPGCEDGNIEYFVCDTCGKWYSDSFPDGIIENHEDVVIPGTGHSKSDDWTSDDTGHWHSCNNLNCEAKLDFAAHTPDADDGDCTSPILCSVCSAITTAAQAHIPSADWVSDAANHWHTCTNPGCSQLLDSAAHTPDPDDGDCTSPILCSACSAITTAAQAHIPSADWVSDTANHWHTCTNPGCSQLLDSAAHTPDADDGDCTTPILCSACRAITTAAQAHIPSADWNGDADFHWHACTNPGCSQLLDFAAHTPDADDGDCTTPILCSACSVITTAAQAHAPSSDWVTDANNHWHTCTNPGCSQLLDSAAHTPYADDSDCSSPVLCSACSAITTAAQAHTPSSDWVTDANKHWHTCTNPGCSQLLDSAAHTPYADDGNCTTAVKCSKCSRVTKKALQHSIDNTKWQNNLTNHWRMCNNKGCGEIFDITAHTMVQFKCSYCGYSGSGAGGCYIATSIFGSYDCPEVWTLRRFRDGVLAKTPIGRLFINTYYAVSPALVEWFGETAWFQSLGRTMLEPIVTALQNKGFASTPYEDQ